MARQVLLPACHRSNMLKRSVTALTSEFDFQLAVYELIALQDLPQPSPLVLGLPRHIGLAEGEVIIVVRLLGAADKRGTMLDWAATAPSCPAALSCIAALAGANIRANTQAAPVRRLDKNIRSSKAGAVCTQEAHLLYGPALLTHIRTGSATEYCTEWGNAT